MVFRQPQVRTESFGPVITRSSGHRFTFPHESAPAARGLRRLRRATGHQPRGSDRSKRTFIVRNGRLVSIVSAVPLELDTAGCKIGQIGTRAGYLGACPRLKFHQVQERYRHDQRAEDFGSSAFVLREAF